MTSHTRRSTEEGRASSLWLAIKLTYDTEADALLIELAAGAVERTIEVGRGTLADLDAEGRVLALDVIRPARPWLLDSVLERLELEAGDRAMLVGAFGRSPVLRLCPLAPLAGV